MYGLKKIWRDNRLFLFFTLVGGVVLAFVLAFLFNRYLARERMAGERIRVRQQLMTLGASFEEELGKSLYLIYGMAAYIGVREEISTHEFDNLAANLLMQSGSISNIAAAPDFVLSYVYPYESNKMVLGVDYREVPDQREAALATRETGSMVVAGPIDLLQGGRGLVARVPVFTGKNKEFWGLVSSLIRLDVLFEHVNMEEKQTGLRLALRGKDGRGEEGDIFWGPRSLFDEGNNSVKVSIMLPNGSWVLAGEPEAGWRKGPRYSWLVYLFFLLIFMLTWLVVVQKRENRTALLESANQFRAMSNSSHDALIIIDADDTITFWNPAAVRMFGFTGKEMIGRKMHDVIVPSDKRHEAREGLKGFKTSGRGPILESVREVEALRKSGENFPVELSVASFKLKGRWFAVGSIRDITQRKAAESELTRLATTDALTGIMNRRQFMKLAGTEMERYLRYGTIFTLLMCDIDHFKQINDTWGHDVGDLVLKTFTETVAREFRVSDYFARIGGEEFVVLLTESNMEKGGETAERVREKVKAITFEKYDGLRFTLSIGVAEVNQTLHSLELLLKSADDALYKAKEGGRDRVMTAE